jgi:putative ABC transport system permease protein
MGTFFQDLRFALRHLRKTPGFSLAAIGTLALGIGATTAIFSTVNAVLLKPLPYPNSKDLYGLRTTLTDGRVTTGLLSPVEIRRLNEANISIVRAAASSQQLDVTLLRDNAEPVKAAAFGVSEGFFEMFGLPMTLGAGFTPEHFAGNGPPVIVLSRRAWRDLFESDPAIVGKAIRFGEFPPTTIVGVAPQDLDSPRGADFYFNLQLGPTDIGHSNDGYMRIKHGVPIERVRDEMSRVMDQAIKDFPGSGTSRIYVVKPMIQQIIGDLGPILVVVLGSTGLLLVLACVNVTNLMLARGATRAREIAVRVALGAGRARIVRQLLTESVIVASIGAAAGLGLAYGGIRLLLRAGASKMPRLDAVPFDSTVLLFALATLVVSGLIVGFAPALRLAATDLKTLMNESGRSASGGRATARWLSGLMVTEIALCVMLVAGAGWLVKSFANLRTVDAGFKTDGRIVFDVGFNGPNQTPDMIVTKAQDFLSRIRSLPGVLAVSTTSNFPLRLQPESSLFAQFKGEAFDASNPMGTRQRIVGPGFFEAMGTKILSGRDFTDADRQGSALVVVVNKTFAQRYLKGRNPLGVHFLSGYPTINPQSEVEIVGVVDDIRQKTLSDPAEPAFYNSDRQFIARRRTVIVHTSAADPMSLQPAIRAELAKTDPQLAVNVVRLSEITGNTIQRQELGMMLMLVFGGAALVLAAVGIYGVIAYAASQRQGEFATRLALGASPMSVFWLGLRQGRTLSVVGAAIGITAAYLVGRVVASRLFEVRASDPSILAGATLIVTAIALLATAIPALRSSRVDPSKVLRPE